MSAKPPAAADRDLRALWNAIEAIENRLIQLEGRVPPEPEPTPPPPALEEVTCFFPPTRLADGAHHRTGVDNSGGRGLYRVGDSTYPAGRWSAPLTEPQIAEIKAASLGDRLATVTVSREGQINHGALDAVTRRLMAEDANHEPDPGSELAAELAGQVKP